MKNSRQIGLSLMLLAVILAGGILFKHSDTSRAAGSCSASLNWNPSSINQGQSATETWNITGAASAVGTCTDGAGINSTISNLNMNGSYAFSNVQKSITCSVTGTTSDGATCTSGSQTVTVVAPNTPPTASSCELFSHTANSLDFFSGEMRGLKFSFEVNKNISIDIGGVAYGIEEYLQSRNVRMVALDPLPPGVTFSARTVKYPDDNLSMDGVLIDGLSIPDWLSKSPENRSKGYPPLTRYNFRGVPTAEGTYTVRLQASSGDCGSETKTFMIVIGPTSDVIQPPPWPTSIPAVPPAEASANGKIKFVKTLFNNPAAPQGSQHFGDVIAWGKKGDKFVFSGEYGGSFNNGNAGTVSLALNRTPASGGGGIWAANEDGSKIVEREADLDAGSGTHIIYRHGARFSLFKINLEWDKGGFVMQNASAGSCLSNISAAQWCPIVGPGANRAVYYKQGSDGFPIKAGDSKGIAGIDNVFVFKNRLISSGYQAGAGMLAELYSLPKWGDLGVADRVSGTTFGDNLIDNTGKLYTVSDDGSAEDSGTNLLDDGYSMVNTTLDWSQGFPPKLAILERQTAGAPNAKIKVYKLASDGSVVFDKKFNGPVFPQYNTFAVWGDYVAVNSSGASLVSGGVLSLWKADQQLDTVKLPAGGIGPIAISKNGYVVTTGSYDSALALLYKLDVTAPSGSGGGTGGGGIGGGGGGTTPTGGGGGGTGVGSGCYAKYPNNVSLRTLCEQIEALKASACKTNPSLTFCKK